MIGIAQTHTLPAGAQGRAESHARAEPGPPGYAAGVVAAAPTLLAIALLLISGWSDGAFQLRSWGPLAVFTLVAVAAGRRNHVRGAALAMAAALWAFAAWSLLSVTWSETPAPGLEGAGRNLLYAALASLPLLTLPSRSWAVATGRLLAAGAGALVVLTFIACLADGTNQFLGGRLNDPVGYRNGSAALFALAFWPLLCVAAQRRMHALVRAACFGTAVLALGLAFLTQSRGVLIGFGCGAIVAIALGPDRVRRAWLAIIAISAVAIASRRLLAPYDAFLATASTPRETIGSAVSALGILAVGGFFAALLLALFDGGLRVSDHYQRRLGGLAAGALAVLSVAAVTGGLIAVGNPVSLVRAKAREFKQLEVSAPGESTRLGSTGGQRYDLWRIAWDEFRSAPLNGVGEGAYPVEYYAHRATDRNLSSPHSLPIRALAETGLVGALLLVGVFVAAAAALARGWRAATVDERRWASALTAAGAVLVGQSTVDWLELIPGLTGLGVVCLATAVAIVSIPRHPPAQPAGAQRRAWQAARVVPLLAAALVALLFLSDVYTRIARAHVGGPSVERLDAARTAERLNPYALPPRYLQAGALEELGRRAETRRELLDALAVEPRNFVTMGLIGDFEFRAGHRAAARRWYRRALRLNPGDVGLQQLAG
jgi:hypothetical protein